jgi:hypothetical protein
LEPIVSKYKAKLENVSLMREMEELVAKSKETIPSPMDAMMSNATFME